MSQRKLKAQRYSTKKKKSYMTEAQRSSKALREAEERWENVRQQIEQEIDNIRDQINNPMGTGDMRLRDLSSAYIRATSLQDTIAGMEATVSEGKQRTQQKLRTRSSSLKTQLIRLGEQRPELREHLRPVLNSFSGRNATTRKVPLHTLDTGDDFFLPRGDGFKWRVVSKRGRGPTATVKVERHIDFEEQMFDGEFEVHKIIR